MSFLSTKPCLLHLAPPCRVARHRSPCKPIKATAVTGQKEKIIQNQKKYLLQTYPRADVVFTRGAGGYLYDTEGKEYLDFSSGIAVNALGHSDPRWVVALSNQAHQLTHTSNLFNTEPSVELAQRLVESSFAQKVFFTNSGTEANEAALKFARKYAKVKNGLDPYSSEVTGPHETVSFTAGFHGRTYGALSITPKDKIRSPFVPLVPGHQLVEFNDLDSASKVIAPGKTCAVFVEPVQGEGGVRIAEKEFLYGLRKLCDETGALLVFDEVQCGVGRSGKLWAYEWTDVEPDMMTLAKPLAGGLPIGATLVKEEMAEIIQFGDHGSTFAGGPLVCQAALTIFDIVNQPDFLQHVQAMSQYLRKELERILKGNPQVKEIRNCGLLFGIQFDRAIAQVVSSALEQGLVILSAGEGNVIRIAPRLNTSESEVDEAIEKLSLALESLQ